MNRRFLYMAAMDGAPRSYALHRIDPWQLFYPKGPPKDAAAAAAAAQNSRLPRPAMSFSPPQSEDEPGTMELMLFGSDKNKIVGADQTGRALLYDGKLGAVRTLPRLTEPKARAISLPIGDVLYVMEAIPSKHVGEHHQSFEALMRDNSSSIGDFLWRPLPPPPYVHAPGYGKDRSGAIVASTVVDGSRILVSTESLGTYWFDTASGEWRKLGDWALPFRGRAEYVREYGLWFGFSATDHRHLCASDLGAAQRRPPPVAGYVWEGFAAAHWTREIESHLVHLGAARFCVAKKVLTKRREPCPDLGCRCPGSEVTTGKILTLTGVEVERRGKAGGGLYMVTGAELYGVYLMHGHQGFRSTCVLIKANASGLVEKCASWRPLFQLARLQN